MKLGSLRLVAALALCLGIGHSSAVIGYQSSPPLFFTPEASAIPEVLDAIAGARTSFHMTMYHLTEPTIIDALISAHKRGVDVQVLLDQQQVASEKANGAFHLLSQAGVQVTKSSSAFSITHEKAFVVDGQTAYIMTLNLTRITSTTRDVAYITSDPGTVRFVDDLFKLDVKNAASQGMASPASVPSNIILSPGARDGIESLVKSARSSIMLMVENFSDPAIIGDLVQAQKNGVRVEVIVPRCDLSSNDFDLPAARQLAAGGVNVRMMPSPMTADTPYIHQKSIVIDGDKAFLGSINYSYNSLDKARELGVVFSELDKVQQMTEQFNTDFNKSLDMAASEAFKCPASPFADEESR